MLNAQMLQGRWGEIKGKLREKWGQLTDDDVARFDGQTQSLIGTIERKTGEGREKIEQVLEEMLSGAGSTVARAFQSAREEVGHAAQTVSRVARSAANTVREGVSGAEQTVREYPAASVSVAFGCGLVTGLFVGLFVRAR